MKTKEFLAAVIAYLEGRANSWQTFLVHDHFDSYALELDILELYRDSEVDVIYERMKRNINRRLDELEDES
jgi:hypothetical protein